MSFLVINLEDVSLQFRSLVSTGLLLGKDMGLHRTQQQGDCSTAGDVYGDMWHCTWWYVVSTDW